MAEIDATYVAECARPGGAGATADARCLSGLCEEIDDGVFDHSVCAWTVSQDDAWIDALRDRFGPGFELAGLFSHMRAIHGGAAVDKAARMASQREAKFGATMKELLTEQLAIDEQKLEDDFTLEDDWIDELMR